MADDPEQKVRFVPDSKTGQLAPQVLYKSIRKTLDNGTDVVQITIDARQVGEIEKIIQRVHRREDLPLLSDEEIQAQIGATKANMGRIDQPEVKFGLEVDIWNYHRAVFKIAYELAWLWLGDEYLDDPVAEQLRNMILKDARDGIKGKVQFGADIAPLAPWKDEPNVHIGFCSGVGHAICISVRIFDSICGAVSVSETADRYPTIGNGNFVMIDPQTGVSRNTTLADELVRVVQRSS